jgi:Flp pilus assembly protein TadG
MVIKVFGRSRRSSVSVMFAAAAIPFIGLIGLAVDFCIWNQTNAQLSVAANASR